jgi:DNA-binding response OmpR family regulator
MTNGNNAYALQLPDDQEAPDLTPQILLASNKTHDHETLGAELTRHGYDIHHTSTASEALEIFENVDLILLDPDLPDLEGIEICCKIRRHSVVPVIVISDRSDEVDCVLALKSGADDYIVKPYRIHELIARIESTLRRIQYQAEVNTVIEYGPLFIDVGARQVTLEGRQVTLTRKEFDLLYLLAANPGVVVRREKIKEKIWGDTWSLRTIDTHVNSLRGKLRRREWIVTIRGVGFMMAEI